MAVDSYSVVVQCTLIPWAKSVCVRMFVWGEHVCVGRRPDGRQRSRSQLTTPLEPNSNWSFITREIDHYSHLCRATPANPTRAPALVLKGEPHGLSFKGEIFGSHSILMERSEIRKNPSGSSWLSLMVPPLVPQHSSSGIWDGHFNGWTQTHWQFWHMDEDRVTRIVTLAPVPQMGRFLLCR